MACSPDNGDRVHPTRCASPRDGDIARGRRAARRDRPRGCCRGKRARARSFPAPSLDPCCPGCAASCLLMHSILTSGRERGRAHPNCRVGAHMSSRRRVRRGYRCDARRACQHDPTPTQAPHTAATAPDLPRVSTGLMDSGRRGEPDIAAPRRARSSGLRHNGTAPGMSTDIDSLRRSRTASAPFFSHINRGATISCRPPRGR